MGQPVPIDDLPQNIVPASDLPTAPKAEKGKPNVSAEPSIGQTLLSAAAPGGLARMTSGAEKSLESGAYKAGGATTDFASGFLPPTAAAALGTGANIGIQSLPMLAGGGIGTTAEPLMVKGARHLMQSSLKPNLADLASGKGERAITTMLQEGKTVSSKSLSELRSEVDKLSKQVEDAVSNSKEMVDKSKVMEGMKDVFDRFKNRLTESERTGDIQGAVNEFLNHPWIKAINKTPEQKVPSQILSESGKPFEKTIPASGTDLIPVQEAHELKKGIYKGLGEKAYGPQAIPAASKEAQKGIAHQLMTGVEEAVPGVGPANKRMKELINAANVASKPVLMDANKNPGGIAWMAHSPETWAAFEMSRWPWLKSALANMMYQGRQGIPAGVGALGGEAVSLGSKLGKPDQR